MALFVPQVDVSHRPYCGPVAISALTGVPISRIEKMLRRCRSDRGRDARGHKIAVRGTWTAQVLTVLRRLDCFVERRAVTGSTFAAFVRDTEFVKGAFLVHVSGHWMTCAGGMYCDTSSLDGPKPIADYHKPARRVRNVFFVDAPVDPKFLKGAPAPTKREKAPADLKAVRAKALADKIAAWERKERRAKNALKKLRPKLARYVRLGVVS